MSRHFRTLQRKYALIFAVLVVGAVVTSSGLETSGTYEDHRLALARIQQAETRGAAAQIEQFFQTLEGDLGSASPAFWGAGGATLEQRAREYSRVLTESPAITQIAYVDSQGFEQLAVSRLEVNHYGSQVDHTQDPLFLASRAKPVAYGDLYFRDGTEPYVTIARAEGKTAGTVLAEVNLKFLRDVVSGIHIGQSGHAYVLDEHGTLVAHPDMSLVLRRTDLSDLPQVRTALDSRTALDDAADHSTTAVDSMGQSVLSTYQVIRPLGWIIVAEQPSAEAFAPLAASLVRVASVLVLGLLIALMGSVFVARRMVRPIHALQAGAARIGRGVLDQPIREI